MIHMFVKSAVATSQAALLCFAAFASGRVFSQGQ